MNRDSISRREFLSASLAAGAYALISSRIPTFAAESDRKLNVLFIAIDDLRPEIGCYDVPVVKTPNIDALARRGTLFNRCYCQEALCCPSRSSLLTGLRPDTTKVYGNEVHFRKNLPDVVTLPQQFKNHGYHAQGLSKIYHGGKDDPQSWSVPHWQPRAPAYGSATLDAELRDRAKAIDRQRGKHPGPPWKDPDVPDNALADGMTADKAVEVLREIKDKPFSSAYSILAGCFIA